MNIYTDGYCLKNPNGPGGWGVLILDKECEWEISGNNPSTTNNIMELQAVIEAIKFVTEKLLIIHSDSTYVIKGITEWIENWIKRDWKKVKNSELWKELYLLVQDKDIEWKWVKAHANNKYNNRVDEIARNCAKEILC